MVIYKRAPGSCAAGDCCDPVECETDCKTRNSIGTKTYTTGLPWSEILFELAGFPADVDAWLIHDSLWHKIRIIGFSQINGSYSMTPNAPCTGLNRPDVAYDVDFEVTVYPFDSGGADPFCPDLGASVVTDEYSGTLSLAFSPTMSPTTEIIHDVWLSITIDSFPTTFVDESIGNIDALLPLAGDASNLDYCDESLIRYRTPFVIGTFSCGIGGTLYGDGSTATTI